MIEIFRQYMLTQGIILPVNIIADGKKHRFSTNEDINDTAGEYCLYMDLVPAGYVKDYRTDVYISWCSKENKALSSEDKRYLQSRAKISEEEDNKQKDIAVKLARQILNESEKASNYHPYLLKKQIPANGVFQNEDKLVIPVFQGEQLISLQYVYSNGFKMFLPGGTIKGGYYIIGKPDKQLFLVEGFATGGAIFKAFGQAVVVAFTSSNLKHLVKDIKKIYPNKQMIICADNDQWPNKLGKINNNGINKAREAASLVNAMVVYPDFVGLDISNKPTDFNDLMCLAGVDAVKKQIENVISINIPAEDDQSIQQLPIIDPKAFFGVIDKFVKASEQNSEASPVAVAANVIAQFCAMIGKTANQWIGDSKIECRPFILIVGKSGKSRKGTSEYLVRRVFEAVEQIFEQRDASHQRLRIHGGGLSSGEGVLYSMRDPSSDGKDQGVTDKRLLVVETEFANVLANCKRDTSTLSATIRNLFDGKDQAPLTKHNIVTVTAPHAVIIGHCTKSELIAKSSNVEINNGLLNRFLPCAIGRSQLVPLPKKTSPEIIQNLAIELVEILDFISKKAIDLNGAIEVELSTEAEKLWCKVYPVLSHDRDGHVGALMARVEQYARMLAMVFCLIDQKILIEVSHLRAAIAWIAYVEKSIEYLFGSIDEQKEEEKTKVLAGKILNILKSCNSIGKSDITKALNGHYSADALNKALSYLLNSSPPHIQEEREKTNGRTKYTYKLITEKKEKYEKKEEIESCD